MPLFQDRLDDRVIMVLVPVKEPVCHQLWSEYDFLMRKPKPYHEESDGLTDFLVSSAMLLALKCLLLPNPSSTRAMTFMSCCAEHTQPPFALWASILHREP